MGECSECERDSRGDHDESCSHYRAELKPCPFCGDKAEFKDGFPKSMVKCRNRVCGARVLDHTEYGMKIDPKEKWNHRTE